MVEVEEVENIHTAKVTYTTKELFAEIRDELRALNVALANKANTRDLEDLERRVDGLQEKYENVNRKVAYAAGVAAAIGIFGTILLDRIIPAI